MQKHEMGTLTDWVGIGLGEVIDFEPKGKVRVVKFEYVSDAKVSVWVSLGDKDEGRMVAFGEGRQVVQFATSQRAEVLFVGPDGANVFMKVAARDQKVQARSDLPKFTKIEPRQRLMTDQQHIMNLMMRNVQRREDALMAELGKAQQRLEALTVTVDKQAQAAAAAVTPVDESSGAQLEE